MHRHSGAALYASSFWRSPLRIVILAQPESPYWPLPLPLPVLLRTPPPSSRPEAAYFAAAVEGPPHFAFVLAVACSCRHSAALLFVIPQRSEGICFCLCRCSKAPKARSIPAWGIAPGNRPCNRRGLKARPIPLLIAHSTRLAALKTASHPQNPQQNPLVKTLEPSKST